MLYCIKNFTHRCQLVILWSAIYLLVLQAMWLVPGDAALGDEPAAKDEAKATEKSDRHRAGRKAQKLSQAFRSAADLTLPCVVTVYGKEVEERENTLAIALEDVLGDDLEEYDNIGSGVILSEDGLVVTNHHVVEQCNRIRVRLPDGREYSGTDVRSEEASDIAILKISSSKKLPTIRLGDSNEVGVGDWVLAVGSPFAIEQTVSAGIISGKGRVVRGLVGGQLLQTDAAINPGNSGGALVDLNGKLVGINTAIASTDGEFQGVGFAIPVNRVKWIVSELQEYGKVRRATMGVTAVAVPPEIAEQLELPVSAGAFVLRVRDGYPAEAAGIQKDDIIIKLADQSVKSPIELNAIVEQMPIDQPLKVVVLRGGETIELTIVLQPRREQESR